MSCLAYPVEYHSKIWIHVEIFGYYCEGLLSPDQIVTMLSKCRSNEDRKCPICGDSPVVEDLCPGSCGSLEGLPNDDSNAVIPRKTSRMFGYDWAQGYVAPFLGVDNDAVHDAFLVGVKLSNEDSVVDLGCGDGRICIIAADRFDATAVGYDLNQSLLTQARQATETQNLQEKVSFYAMNLFDVDLEPFTVVTMFLLPDTFENSPVFVQKLHRFLKEQQGRRIIAFGWKIPCLGEPVRQCNIDPRTCNSKDDYSGLLKRWYVYETTFSPPPT